MGDVELVVSREVGIFLESFAESEIEVDESKEDFEEDEVGNGVEELDDG